jgi:5-methylcytosine-specific restriction endonuclease McrA
MRLPRQDRPVSVHDPFYDTQAWRNLRQAVKLRDGWRCTNCGRQAALLDVDHIVPIGRGGAPLDPTNLRTLCRTCHNRKRTRRTPKRRNSRRW